MIGCLVANNIQTHKIIPLSYKTFEFSTPRFGYIQNSFDGSLLLRCEGNSSKGTLITFCFFSWSNSNGCLRPIIRMNIWTILKFIIWFDRKLIFPMLFMFSIDLLRRRKMKSLWTQVTCASINDLYVIDWCLYLW